MLDKKTAYVIYDSLVELDNKLDKLKEIFFLAEFSGDLVFTDIRDETALNDLDFFTSDKIAYFCINNTYSKFSNYFSNKLATPLFEFSLNEYYDEKYNLVLFGIDLKCEDMFFKSEHKRNTWRRIQNFVSNFEKLNFSKLIKKPVEKDPVVEQSTVLTIEELPTYTDTIKESIVVLNQANMIAASSLQQNLVKITHQDILELSNCFQTLSQILNRVVIQK